MPVRSSPKGSRVFTGKFDRDKICNYCHEKGHWKADCFVLKNKSKRLAQGSHVKPTVLVASVQVEKSQSVENEEPVDFFSSYTPFVTEGFVSLVGGEGPN